MQDNKYYDWNRGEPLTEAQSRPYDAWLAGSGEGPFAVRWYLRATGAHNGLAATTFYLCTLASRQAA
jgi:hypothetical protein